MLVYQRVWTSTYPIQTISCQADAVLWMPRDLCSPESPWEIPLGIAPAYSVLCQFLASNEVTLCLYHIISWPEGLLMECLMGFN
jgi:hypothetical protein